MPTHKSAKKQVRASKRAQIRNKMGRSRLRTAVTAALESKKKEEAEKLLKIAVSILDKSVGKGLIHRNNAAHKKARYPGMLQS